MDVTARHQLLSFMDAYSGYNQVLVFETDQEVASLITDQGLFYYTVVVRLLRNAGATYQRLVMKMFKEYIGDTMKVYINDMVVKSLKNEDHLRHLEKTSQIPRQHKMMLNLAKCTFEIPPGKFLGYIWLTSVPSTSQGRIQ